MASGPIWVTGSKGSPTLTWRKFSLSASTNASWRVRLTMMRVSDAHTWPVRKIARDAMFCAAIATS
ncbi:hypothetical protein D3C86_1883280 [compost metagenome]